MLIPLSVSVQPPPAATPPPVVVKIGTPYIEERRAPMVPPRPQSRKASKPLRRQHG
jgi:hypothetical protein